MIDRQKLHGLTQFGVSENDIKKLFPENSFLFVAYDENGVVQSLQNIVDINESFLIGKIKREGVAKHCILKYPFNPLSAAFYNYCLFVAKPTNRVNFDKMYIGWVDEYLTQKENESRLGNSVYEVEFFGLDTDIQKFCSEFVLDNEKGEMVLNILYLLQSKSKLIGMPLFGKIISKAVTSVYFDGVGLLPEYLVSEMHYLVGGLQSKSADKEKYEEAKKLARKGLNLDVIVSKTGWILNAPDGKPRFPIPNANAKWKTDAHLFKVTSSESILASKEPTNEVKNDFGFNFSNSRHLLEFPKLGEILDFPELFEAYPNFVNIPVCIGVCNSLSGGTRGAFSETPVYNISSIYEGDWEDVSDSVLSTLIHEIQHGIQNEEGFSGGGNTFFSRLAMASGVDFYRRYRSTLNDFEQIFLQRSHKPNAKENFKRAFLENPSFAVIQEYFNGFQSSKLEQFSSIFSFCFLIYLLKSSEQDFMNFVNTTREFMYAQSDLEETPVFMKLVENTKEVNAKFNALRRDWNAKGYDDNDLNAINFAYYLAFGGEIESRYVQQSFFQKIPVELQKKLRFLSYENTINNLYIFDKSTTEIKGTNAFETAKGKGGVLHLEKSENPFILLHEIGHAVYDLLKKANSSNEIKYFQSFENQSEIEKDKGFSEFCANSFVSYLKRKKIEEQLTKYFPLGDNIGIELDAVFEKFLNYEVEDDYSEKVEMYLQYLKEMQK
jgi:hypothetical protein